MPSLSSPADPSAALTPDCIVAPSSEGNGRCAPQQAVGAVLRRRIKYIARFVYWAARHRSTKHVAWVLAFEGFSWH